MTDNVYGKMDRKKVTKAKRGSVYLPGSPAQKARDAAIDLVYGEEKKMGVPITKEKPIGYVSKGELEAAQKRGLAFDPKAKEKKLQARSVDELKALAKKYNVKVR